MTVSRSQKIRSCLNSFCSAGSKVGEVTFSSRQLHFAVKTKTPRVKFPDPKSPPMHVFGLWEGLGEPGQNSHRRRESNHQPSPLTTTDPLRRPVHCTSGVLLRLDPHPAHGDTAAARPLIVPRFVLQSSQAQPRRRSCPLACMIMYQCL